MKTGFSPEEQKRIRRGKEILFRLKKSSGLEHATVVDQISDYGLPLKVTTLSNWLNLKAGNYLRPKPEYIQPLVAIYTQAPPESPMVLELVDEINLLLGYLIGPATQELMQNKISDQLRGDMVQALHQQQQQMQKNLYALDEILDAIEPKIFEYDKGYPTIYLEKEERKLLWQLLGKENKELHAKYSVEGGYEIPLTQIASLDHISTVINQLNEGIRLLQAYVDKHTLETEKMGEMDFYRVEDFVIYAWEISDRLLNNNALCKSVPALKRALLRTMTVAWGIRYILKNQNQTLSEVQFYNTLILKGKDNQADLNCSVAVYMGMLARQYLKTKSAQRVTQGLNLFEKASQMLRQFHDQLALEQERFYYKKELANLCYDIPNFMRQHPADFADFESQFTPLMQEAHALYKTVVETPNSFYQGLNPQRQQFLHIFYVLSGAWSLSAKKATKLIATYLVTDKNLDQSYWQTHIALAIAWGILAWKEPKKNRASYQDKALDALIKARLVNGFHEATDQEIKEEFVLQQLPQSKVK